MKKLREEGILEPEDEEDAEKVEEDEENVESGGELGRVDVTVVPPLPVGTFSEEERSRQVS